MYIRCPSRQACSGLRKDYKYIEKEDSHMNIAVTYENGNVFQHFGHTEQFKIYSVTEHTGKVIDD